MIASMPPGAIMGLASKSSDHGPLRFKSIATDILVGSRSIPHSMMFAGIAAGGGQLLVNHMAARKRDNDGDHSSWLGSRWSPLKKLTDAEYADMMSEKILRVEADIALIDEHIDKLKDQEATGFQQGRDVQGPERT